MQARQKSNTENALLNPIRVETALSRYPVHRLAKKGEIVIDLQEKDERGEITLKWRVTYNSGFGQPGPLAYKLDTLIVNRRIEEHTRPIPHLIRLGSLRDICRELGINEGQATRNIKNALHQNSSAYITATTTYKTVDGQERSIELGDTRYGVIFTGQTLPDGRKADAVYIVLHDRYREILNNAITRPLDYDYLKSLHPTPQRFYEILSYQMYAAIQHDRPRAKLIYSELCAHAPQTRHLEWEKVRSQMNKVHRPHLLSGYIGKKVDFHQTIDSNGQADWIMHYMPGIKARAEYRAFTRRAKSGIVDTAPPAADLLPLLPAPTISPLEQLLINRGVHAASAAELVRGFTEEQITRQIESLDWLNEKKPKKVTDAAAYLVEAIKKDYAAPKGFIPKAEREHQAEAKRQKDEAAAAARRQQRAADEAERRLAEQAKAYLQSRTPEQRAQLEAEAIAQASEETRCNLDSPAMKPYRKTLLAGLVKEHIARQLQAELEPV